MVFSVTLIPAMLALLPIPKRAPEARLSLLRRGLGAYGRGVLARKAVTAVIMASTFRSVSQMGFLISLAMLSTCFAALTILPVLLAWLRPKFLTR